MAAAAALSLMPVAAKADPSFGFGISFIIGGDVSVGVRVFSDDEAERGALALGLDYKLRSKAWRPNIGAAYLDEDFYVDLNLGLDLSTNELDYGIGLGLTSGVNAPVAVTPPSPRPSPGA
ncbi:hypothetical protein shim_18180 [Shimia sp. SK013]|nr:hypothetical protein shim_18180 [Shimia sp. SK013]